MTDNNSDSIGQSLGAIPGSHPSGQAQLHGLGATRFDPARIDELRAATVALIVAAEQDTVADWPSGVDGGFLDRAWSAIDETYPVIWTAEQVAKIDEWQSCGWVHPLTCPNHSDHWHKDEDGEEVLPFALPQGLVCRSCGYRQFWVPPVCLEGAPPNPIDAIAMEAATAGETCNRLDPKDDSAGRRHRPNGATQPTGEGSQS